MLNMFNKNISIATQVTILSLSVYSDLFYNQNTLPLQIIWWLKYYCYEFHDLSKEETNISA